MRHFLAAGLAVVLISVGTQAAAAAPATAGSTSAGAALGAVTVAQPDSSRRLGGRTRSRDFVLHQRCHSYPFRYALHGVGHDWSAELRLVGPRGGHVASHFFFDGNESTSGHSAWRVCAYAAPSALGRYTIRMRVTRYDAISGHQRTAQARPSTFRLVRPRRG